MHHKHSLSSRLWRVVVAGCALTGVGLAVDQGVQIAHGYPGMPAFCDSPPTTPSTALTPANAAQRAQRAYSAMLTCFAVGGDQFRNEYVGNATLWGDSWAIAAMQSLALSPHPPAGLKQQIQGRLSSLQQYWSGSSSPAGYSPGTPFLLWGNSAKNYDDNNWVALAFLDADAQAGTQTNLKHAEQVFALDIYGWQSNPKLPSPGGVLWTQSGGDTDRATVSTASAALLGARLYGITGKTEYLTWSLRMVDWVNNTLKMPNGGFADHISSDGVVSPVQWSYNQGLMLGAYTELYQVTGDQQYLTEAQSIAAACMRSLAQGENGPINFSSTPFNARFFQYLMQLNAVAPNPQYVQALASDAARVNRRLNSATGAFYTTDRSQLLLEQAGAVQILALYSSSTRDLHAPVVSPSNPAFVSSASAGAGRAAVAGGGAQGGRRFSSQPVMPTVAGGGTSAVGHVAASRSGKAAASGTAATGRHLG